MVYLGKIIEESVLATAGVMFLICAANAFATYLTREGIPATFSTFLMGSISDPIVLLLVVNLMLLVIGFFFEGGSAIILMTPLLLPVATQLGIDPVHFGIIMAVNLTIAGFTPPVGTMMFICISICKVKLEDYVPLAVELGTSKQHPFGKDIWHVDDQARGCRADIDMVRGIARKPHQPTLIEDRNSYSEIRRMTRSVIGMVMDHHVALIPFAIFKRFGDAAQIGGGRPDMHWRGFRVAQCVEVHVEHGYARRGRLQADRPLLFIRPKSPRSPRHQAP